MAGNPHFRELLLALSESEAEYLIVGGYAVMKYTQPRFTKDLDVWVRNSPENAARVHSALARFGAPLTSDAVTSETFMEERVVYQLGISPVRIDISTSIDGVDFDEAWPNRVTSELFGLPVNFISLTDLIKKQTGGGTEHRSGRPEVAGRGDQEQARRIGRGG
jgi:hypothetical protein